MTLKEEYLARKKQEQSSEAINKILLTETTEIFDNKSQQSICMRAFLLLSISCAVMPSIKKNVKEQQILDKQREQRIRDGLTKLIGAYFTVTSKKKDAKVPAIDALVAEIQLHYYLSSIGNINAAKVDIVKMYRKFIVEIKIIFDKYELKIRNSV